MSKDKSTGRMGYTEGGKDAAYLQWKAEHSHLHQLTKDQLIDFVLSAIWDAQKQLAKAERLVRDVQTGRSLLKKVAELGAELKYAGVVFRERVQTAQRVANLPNAVKGKRAKASERERSLKQWIDNHRKANPLASIAEMAKKRAAEDSNKEKDGYSESTLLKKIPQVLKNKRR